MTDISALKILELAKIIHRQFVNQHGRVPLDEKTAMWIIQHDAWMEIVRAADLAYVVSHPTGRKDFMGIPVRLTVYDEPDAPMIQLVMEADMAPR